MHEDFDYFEDLDEKATARTSSSNQHLRQKWNAAKASDDIEEIESLLSEIDLNACRIRRQIELYKQFPSQRTENQTFEWLKRAMAALDYHETMYRALDHRHKMLSGRVLEEKRRIRMIEQAELVLKAKLLEARTKVTTLKLEIKRTRDQSRRLVRLLRKMGVLDGLDMQAVGDQVRAMPPTAEEMRAQEDLDRWKEKLKQVKAEIEKHKNEKVS